MVSATSSNSGATAVSTNDEEDSDRNVIRDVVAVSDESEFNACGEDAAVACGSWMLAVATGSSRMASCVGGLHRRPSYTCTPFPYRRHYAVRRKNGVLLPR